MDKLFTKSSVIYNKKATAYWLLAACCCFFNYSVAQEQKKSWLLLVYMAADNDLESFATKNLTQMQNIGSTENIHIVVHLASIKKDIKTSTLYHVQHGSLITLQEHTSDQSNVDTGDPQTLVNFCTYALKHFPADHNALIFWNHGTGILDPTIHNRTPYLHLFSLNKARHKQRLAKSNIHALPIATYNVAQKAICFDETSGNFLTESDLVEALSIICNTVLHKPFDLIGFDACLMSMIEIATTISPYATYLVASQEVELGWGWNYEFILKPFKQASIQPKTFGIHIVNCYAKMYDFLDDYSLSLIDTKQAIALKNNTDRVAHISNMLLQQSNKATFKDLIKLSRNKHFCTHFDEPSFIDLTHFYQNIITHQKNYTPDNQTSLALWQELLDTVTQGITLITQKVVLYNKTGKKAPYAHGISIYFPEYAIHHSYFDSLFGQSTAWLSFLNLYLQGD